MKGLKEPGFKVLGDRCVVLEDKLEEATSSGIIIPGREKEPTFRGTVVAIGDGAMLENGTKTKMEVSVGDRVIYTNWSGNPVQVGEDVFLVLNCRDLICILDK